MLFAPVIALGANTPETRESTFNVYGVGAKTDENQDSHAGIGIMFDSEFFKFKAEGTSDFFKSGAVFKFNPIADKWYIKAGAGYLNQKMYAPDNTNERINQYSGAIATGYMIQNDLYIEVGGSLIDLQGENIGNDYEIIDETTELVYLEVAKRWNSSIGTIDTTANAGEVFHEFVSDEFSYGVGIDYYPVDNAKIGYRYQNEENNIVNTYSAQYGLIFTEYSDNISQDTYQVTAGVKVAFTNLLDISSYRIPTNIKPHLSELHRFESVSLVNNLNIQSSNGVIITDEAINRINTPDTPSNTTPSATSVTFDMGFGAEIQTFDLAASISDTETADGGLTINVVAGPTQGSLSWSGTQFTFSATQGSGYVGDDSFTYNVTDAGALTSSTRTVTILNIAEDGNVN